MSAINILLNQGARLVLLPYTSQWKEHAQTQVYIASVSTGEDKMKALNKALSYFEMSRKEKIQRKSVVNITKMEGSR